MSEQQILLAFGGIGVAALGCQWLAWRLKLPAILFLLLSGILAGPIPVSYTHLRAHET